MIRQRIRRHEAGEETFVLEDSDLLAGVLLRDRDLSGSKMVNCDMRECSLQRTDLSGADLRGSDLRGADLRGTDLTGANLEGTRMDASVPTPIMESQEEGPEGVDDREPSDVWEEPDNPVEFMDKAERDESPPEPGGNASDEG